VNEDDRKAYEHLEGLLSIHISQVRLEGLDRLLLAVFDERGEDLLNEVESAATKSMIKNVMNVLREVVHG
jgi:hypothetical protein